MGTRNVCKPIKTPMPRLTYNKAQAKVDSITDKLGQPIDNGIREVVISFIMLGLSTSASCEGHLNWGCSHPWVEFSVDSEEENKRCRMVIDNLLHNYPNNEYLCIRNDNEWTDGFRLQTCDALTPIHLTLLQKEMDDFATYVLDFVI